jgi:choline dehydrogenase
MVNAAAMALPPDNDWEHIAEVTGDESWRAKNMRKYFERLEDNHYLPEGTVGHGFPAGLGRVQNRV